jgi:putative sigma-54 modulation protein
MRVTISFRNIRHTKTIDQKIQEKSEKLAKFLEGKSFVKWACNFEDGHFYAEVSLIGPKFEYHAHSSSDTLLTTLDQATHKIQKQIQKRKDKLRNRIHTKHKEVVIMDVEQAWSDSDIEDDLKDVA